METASEGRGGARTLPLLYTTPVYVSPFPLRYSFPAPLTGLVPLLSAHCLSTTAPRVATPFLFPFDAKRKVYQVLSGVEVLGDGPLVGAALVPHEVDTRVRRRAVVEH